ncbi:hypothetical protein SAMN05444156_1844 [Verrucomicrobium sp. GAS474]|uniref:hypothetical protein n=1 Tax=Verrucomicrobium sp. GAS474 TaxID=1882831 RepID=UPI00087C96F0|nr:hypothetical protein [Verrucomicrobium sp. GAS474]SDU08053.1 hypothetical protein SAMN05444156_1844 [Verrucomicrobium sp. GAS474]
MSNSTLSPLDGGDRPVQSLLATRSGLLARIAFLLALALIALPFLTLATPARADEIGIGIGIGSSHHHHHHHHHRYYHHHR